MAETWGAMGESVTNPQTVMQAIAQGVDAHNNDPDAHLGPTQALQSHRAAEVIDHLAESVVNDKIQRAARAYVAVVGSGALGDFNNIQAAVAYATGLGGGTILIMPGTHYITGVCNVPISINFEGIDADACEIVGNYAAGDYIEVISDTATNQMTQQFRNIKIRGSAGGTIIQSTGELLDGQKIVFDRCILGGGGVYIDAYYTTIEMRDCRIECNTEAAIKSTGELHIVACKVVTATAGVRAKLTARDTTGGDRIYLHIRDSTFAGYATGGVPWIDSAGVEDFTIKNTQIQCWDPTLMVKAPQLMIGNQIAIQSGKKLSTSALDGGGSWVGNYIGGTVEINTDKCVYMGNAMDTVPIGTYAGNVIRYNSYEVPVATRAAGTTALDFRTAEVVKLTPNSTRTLSTTIPPAGSRRTLLIVTSGVTSYTMIFGSGFQTTATLATGTTSARTFAINFVCDGTKLIEVSRTAAMA